MFIIFYGYSNPANPQNAIANTIHIKRRVFTL